MSEIIFRVLFAGMKKKHLTKCQVGSGNSVFGLLCCLLLWFLCGFAIESENGKRKSAGFFPLRAEARALSDC